MTPALNVSQILILAWIQTVTSVLSWILGRWFQVLVLCWWSLTVRVMETSGRSDRLRSL
ncbi:hypothetical protein LDENG_00293760 [Lucifuga dentata]|nr:hypothetical protein LDENG_00293760 [Lucifuga dentata]